MRKVALVLPAFTKDARKLFEDFTSYLKVEIDILFLCSESKEKILKKDIDLDFETFNSYDLVCPVGAEAFKHVCKLTGITRYNGTLIDNKYVPLLHPSLVSFKPQYRNEINKAFSFISKLATSSEKLEELVKEDEGNYEFVDTRDKFEKYLPNILKADPLVVDTETDSLSPQKGGIIGIVFSWKKGQAIYVSKDVFTHYVPQLKENFKNKHLIFHNAKFDIKFMKEEWGFEIPFYDDTMLLHYCLEESVGTHSLKDLAIRFTNLGDYSRELEEYKKSFCRKNKILLKDFNYSMIPLDILAPYGCKDGDATIQLFSKFKPKIEESEKFSSVYNNILIPATEALMMLESNGGPIDKYSLYELDEQFKEEIDELTIEIREHPAVARFERVYEKIFNPRSVANLRSVFFDILNLTPLKKTATGAWSTDAETLEYLDHPLAKKILALRTKNKLRTSYVENIIEGLDSDSRLRSGFNIHGTTSGRLSSSGVINYQNIPRDNKSIKKLFKARKGFKIVQCDLATAEVYYAAVLSNDKFLQQAFKNKLDFHSYVAKQMFSIPILVEEIKKHPLYSKFRQYAKAITFGIMYQAGHYTVAEQVNKQVEKEEDKITNEMSKSFIKKYFEEAKELHNFIEKNNSFIAQHAYIYSFFGRKRRLPESRSENRGVAKHAIRSGVNFLIQSVASDINLFGLISLVRWIKENKYERDILPFTVVHDSIVSEVREDLVPLYIENLRLMLQKDKGISIPNCPIGVDFSVGDSWGDL